MSVCGTVCLIIGLSVSLSSYHFVCPQLLEREIASIPVVYDDIRLPRTSYMHSKNILFVVCQDRVPPPQDRLLWEINACVYRTALLIIKWTVVGIPLAFFLSVGVCLSVPPTPYLTRSRRWLPPALPFPPSIDM